MKEAPLLERPDEAGREGLTREELEGKSDRLETENGRLRADLAFLQKSLKVAEILAEHNARRAMLAEKEATTDTLTGINNRRGLEKAINERSSELKENIVVVLADANGFKPINDRLGHAAGDAVLKGIVDHLKNMVRSTDEIELARTGGDEFIVLCFGGEEEKILEKFGEGVAFDMDYEGEKLSISLSTGVAAKLPGETIEDAVRRADERMYDFKREHGGAR